VDRVYGRSSGRLPERNRDRHTADVFSGRCPREALKPAPEEALRNWKVSPQLNRTGVGDDDDPTAIELLAPPSGAQQGAARIYVLPMYLGAGTFAAVLVADPWAALAVGDLIYLGMLPFSVRSFRRLKREAEDMRDVADAE
jgi:hypothetical protein